MKVIQEPTLDDNILIYAVNDVAQQGIDIVKKDARVRQILDDAIEKEKAAVTIAAIQPTVMVDRKTGELFHSSAGQVLIVANWQMVGGLLYSEPRAFDEIINKKVESHQQIWNILVDIDKRHVTQLSQRSDRLVTDTAKSNIVRADVNMFVPNAIVVNADSNVRWYNPSSLPHNVVGIFNQSISSDIAGTAVIHDNSTNRTISNGSAVDDIQSSSFVMSMDSGFIKPGTSWQHRFDEAGVFNYLCTIHAEEGMRGSLIVAAPTS